MSFSTFNQTEWILRTINCFDWWVTDVQECALNPTDQKLLNKLVSCFRRREKTVRNTESIAGVIAERQIHWSNKEQKLMQIKKRLLRIRAEYQYFVSRIGVFCMSVQSIQSIGPNIESNAIKSNVCAVSPVN